MRPFNLVIDAIVNQIPKDYHNYDKVVETLTELKGDANAFTAPEAYSGDWELLGTYLNLFFGVNDTPWENLISQICKEEVDYTLYL